MDPQHHALCLQVLMSEVRRFSRDFDPRQLTKTLTLKSPVGKEAMVYSWPLKKGKGSLRRSEDKQDEAAEILETIR